MDGNGVVGHYGVDCLKLRALLIWIYELIVGTSRQDFSIDFSSHFPSSDRNCHPHTMRILAAIDCLSNFCPNVKNMREEWGMSNCVGGSD